MFRVNLVIDVYVDSSNRTFPQVLNDAKGRTATVTTVVEETRQEYAVPRNFLFDDDFGDLTDGLMESVGFSDDDLRAAMEDNAEALADLLSQVRGGTSCL